MEILSCSDVQYVGQSNCPQRDSETNFMCHGESVEDGKQVQVSDVTHIVDDFVLNGECFQNVRLGEDQRRVDEQLTYEGVYLGTSHPEHTEEGQEFPCSMNAEKQNNEAFMPAEILLNVEKIEAGQPSSNRDGESHPVEAKWLEQEETLALWVKWRGKWQAGIRCERADCPLSTLKARPTHDRKKYFVVFFPHTRNYSWADLLLVRPIHEFPEPIAHRTHSRGVAKVTDLSLPRRFIIQKLAIGMVNISDQLHNEAVIEGAREVTAWKEFAVEASRCKGYSDLGKMLLKLQSMILHQFIDPNWLQTSFDSWTERCQNAQSAACVETLKESCQLGCACPHSTCSPEACDHIYLFDNDYEDAMDIDGQPMHGRFPYDEKGRIILKENYLVYECNSMCQCDRSCRNRVLQNGVKVKLEVFKTENKGWAVRAGEAILRGTFVCEYIGEVLNDQEANKRVERYDNEGCSYLYHIDAHIDNMSELIEEHVSYMIDATRYGNVSRFINHSCSPNLVIFQVLVDSMDCQLAHIGLYANRDIAEGEELAYDYRHELLPEGGQPCYCGAPNCRGRLY